MNKVSSNGLPRKVYDQRNRLIVRFNADGNSSITIHRKINGLAEMGRWYPIALRTVQKVLTDDYRSKDPPPIQNPDDEPFLWEALVEEMEMTIERLYLYTDNREETRVLIDSETEEKAVLEGLPFASFEYAQTMKSLTKMYKDLEKVKKMKPKKTPKTVQESDSPPQWSCPQPYAVRMKFIEKMQAEAKQAREFEERSKKWEDNMRKRLSTKRRPSPKRRNFPNC